MGINLVSFDSGKQKKGLLALSGVLSSWRLINIFTLSTSFNEIFSSPILYSFQYLSAPAFFDLGPLFGLKARSGHFLESVFPRTSNPRLKHSPFISSIAV
jgi:hypothetical protein